MPQIPCPREYPCDHYTAIINVTLMCTGCPRAPVHESALQLLQLLDKRFFGSVGPLQEDGEPGESSPRIPLQATKRKRRKTVRWRP